MRVKKKAALFIMAGIFILTAFSLNGCIFFIRTRRTYEETFKLNWGIVLPGNMTREFSEAERSWSGEGIRYAVFKLEEEPVDFIADFSREKEESFEDKVNKVISRAEFKVSEKFLPDWEAAYYWKHTGNKYGEEYEFYGDNLYMIYFPDAIKLICCEDIT